MMWVHVLKEFARALSNQLIHHAMMEIQTRKMTFVMVQAIAQEVKSNKLLENA